MTNQEIIDKGREVWSSWSEWEKDIEHKDSYSFTKKECKIIRKEDFKCSNCGKNIFELNDFPVIRDDMVFCEECYSDEYDEICSLCEEIEERKDNEEEQPFPKNPFFYSVKDDEEHIPGIYEAIKYPIWSSNGFSTDIWWDNVKFVCSKEDYLKQYPDRKDNFENAEYICNDCYNIAKEIRDKNNA
jgi:DNA-directed RNA polymerase subunit RPC12/RpoP